MLDLQLSPHFAYKELVTTSHIEFSESNETSGQIYVPRLRALCVNILEPIRNYVKQPVIIDSGFRCQGLNTKLSGEPKSQHLFGEAADIQVQGYDLDSLFQWITKDSKLYYGQCINEKHNIEHWIHISLGSPYRDALLCCQALTWDGDKYTRVN